MCVCTHTHTGVAYGLMFDLTALSHAALTVSAIATGSGPQVKIGSKVWVFVCSGSYAGTELSPQEWGQIGEGDLELPRPSFKSAEYTEYGELPISKSFIVYPNQTMGVCIMTSSPGRNRKSPICSDLV